ncbi:MAG TPA: PAS domain-containing protein [Rhodocyclaceae bacterium]|nr:PAS domain-containing protein [Rhodocyclaceae bacterium]
MESERNGGKWMHDLAALDHGLRFDSRFHHQRSRSINRYLIALLISSLIPGIAALTYVRINEAPAILALVSAIAVLLSLFLANRIAFTARVAGMAKNTSDLRLRMAMKMGSMVAFALDKNLRFTWFHSSHPDLEQIVVGQNETDLFSPETAGTLSAMHYQVLKTGMEVRRDVMVQIKEKLKQRYFDLMLRPMYDEAGDIAGVIGIAIDITERKRTEKQLRESQEDLNLAQAVARTGSWRVNIWSNELIWSDETWRIFGIAKGTHLSYERYMDAIHPEDRNRVAQHWTDALHGEPYDIDHRILVNEEERWVRQRATLEYDEQGILVGGFGTAQDITERKRLGEEIRQREQYLRAVLDNMPFMLWLKDERSNFLAVNANFAHTFGWPSPESLIGKNDFHIAQVDLAVAYRDDDKVVLHSGNSKHMEELIFTEGEYRWFETYKSPVIIDGKVVGTVGYARDVSQQRRMESRLRESEAFNVAVLNSLTEHIAVLDEHGTIVAVNTAWKQFAQENGAPELVYKSVGLNYREASISASGPRSSEEGEDAWHGIEQVIKGMMPHFKCEYVRPSKTEDRHFRMSAYPLPMPRRGAVVSHEDITARKKAEEAMKQATAKAEQANNAKSRFLAAASHDLRQPLSALALYVGMLSSCLGTEDAALLRNMKDCLSSLNELLSNLLDLSMLEAGVTKPEIRDFPLEEAFSKAVSVHAPEANIKGLLLRCADTRLAARTDPVLFGRMLRNLVSNAVRYTESGGVLVGCRRRDGKLWVEVWDTGIGIPDDKTTEIFEEFKQLDNDERSRGKGSGLGLAIVAKTAALLGLEIRVKSVLGRGSMFAVEFPLGKAAETEMPDHADYKSLWIGVVENDPAVLEALTRSLESIGHQVVDASTGSELLELLDGIPPDIVVSDYRLANGESGFDVIKRVRATFEREVPALVITGDTDSLVMRHMANQGIRVLHKPLELATLQECMAQLTAAKH